MTVFLSSVDGCSKYCLCDSNRDTTLEIPETAEVPGVPEAMETQTTEENAGVVSLTIHLHHPISITANKPHIYVDDVTFQKYPQLSPHASEDFIKVL